MKISLDKLVKYGKLYNVEKCNWPRTRSGAFVFFGVPSRSGVSLKAYFSLPPSKTNRQEIENSLWHAERCA